MTFFPPLMTIIKKFNAIAAEIVSPLKLLFNVEISKDDESLKFQTHVNLTWRWRSSGRHGRIMTEDPASNHAAFHLFGKVCTVLFHS